MGYHTQSIENISWKAKPIYVILSLPSENSSKSNHKLKKAKEQKSSGEPILWSKYHANIIPEFIEELKSLKTMTCPDFTKPFIVHCDVSENGLGAVLYQEVDGKMKIISSASQTWTPAEKNYHLHSGQLEFLRFMWSVTEKFWDCFYYAN